MQDSKNGTFGKLPIVILPGKPKEEFEKQHAEGNSFLTTVSKYIEFCGLRELTDRACDHVVLKNPTNKTIIFTVTKPKPDCFFVRPRIGMIEPYMSATIYCTFRANKCQSLPRDYCWNYDVDQIQISEEDTKFIKEDEFSSGNLRKVWNENCKGDIEHFHLLCCVFPQDKKAKYDCKEHRRMVDRGLHLNDQGEVEQVVKAEASNTPSTANKNRKKNDKSDVLPPTARD